LDTNQLHREQMCRAILAIDKRLTEVRPRHPRGGPDGGRDIEAVYNNELITFGAVGFVNQANDSDEQKKKIQKKFRDDLESALDSEEKCQAFIFMTNINLTIGEKESLIKEAKKRGIIVCEIFDRERLRIQLDSPDGFSIRFQYLNIPLSEEEQASFFARWGDDIQSVISTGFQRVENTLNRILFYQEANDALSHLSLSLELDKIYSAEEIGHFRLFCMVLLKEPIQKILSILFGSSDKSNRMSISSTPFTEQKVGIKHGISTGQWESYLDLENLDSEEDTDVEDEKYESVGTGSSIGIVELQYLSISYSKDHFIRIYPNLKLRDIDDAMVLPIMNKSLACKIKRIHINSNGYRIKTIENKKFSIDTTSFTPNIPAQFTDEELRDPWVRIRPKRSSAFRILFFEETPKRMFKPKPVTIEKK